MPLPIATYFEKNDHSSNFSGVTSKGASEKGKAGTKVPDKKPPVKKDTKTSKDKKEKEEPKMDPFFIVPADERIENDNVELHNQKLSSWAQTDGLSTKSNAIMKYGLKIEKNEIESVERV